jgi:hypothetical protein
MAMREPKPRIRSIMYDGGDVEFGDVQSEK